MKYYFTRDLDESLRAHVTVPTRDIDDLEEWMSDDDSVFIEGVDEKNLPRKIQDLTWDDEPIQFDSPHKIEDTFEDAFDEAFTTDVKNAVAPTKNSDIALGFLLTLIATGITKEALVAEKEKIISSKTTKYDLAMSRLGISKDDLAEVPITF